MTAPTQTNPAETNPAETQTPASLLFFDLDNELATTRRMLERVPDGNEEWQPHEKSMKLGALASHLAQLPSLGMIVMNQDEFDVANRPPQAKVTNNAERVKLFDDFARQLRSLVQNLTWEQAMSTWRFRFGDRVIVEGPRANVIRTLFITHSTHHRAQLGVYLRLLGIPIPGSYGPSADEPLPPPR